MPTYRTRSGKRTKKNKGTRKYQKRLPRDPTKLLRWAARGTDKDYDKLRKFAKKARASVPEYIDKPAFDRLTHVDRLTMIEEIQASEEHNVSAGFFFDGINWLLDKVPWGNWIWPVGAAQSAINAQKGDSLNEVDEQYARLVGATYGTIEDRPFVIDHWKRQVQFDSDYISVYDNPDGHRVICVRGTQGTSTDMLQDLLISVTGRSTNLIGPQLLDIIAATPQGTVVDLASHSLGTALSLQAYSNSPLTYERIHETYLYNPANSPVTQGSAHAYARDENVRYFINVHDAVSMGQLGSRAPANVVFRSEGNPLSAHSLAQWQGSSSYQEPVYHDGPETREHAHKLAFPENVEQSSTKEDDVRDTDRADESAAEVRDEIAAFDFGDTEFDYEGL